MVSADYFGEFSRAITTRLNGGDGFEIMFDRTAVRPGWVWDYDTALEVARGMERYNARWLEEPFDGHDLEGPARLPAEVDIPITGGELGKSIHQFLAFLTHKTYDVLQPDTRICGGILNARKISILGEAFHVPCIQHGTQGLSLAGYIQAGCAMPNCDYQEMIGQTNLPQEQWSPALKVLRTKHVFEIEDGYVKLPETQDWVSMSTPTLSKSFGFAPSQSASLGIESSRSTRGRGRHTGGSPPWKAPEPLYGLHSAAKKLWSTQRIRIRCSQRDSQRQDPLH